jgi:hypothetical protein
MNNTALVGTVKTIANIGAILQHLGQRQRAFREPISEGFAFQVLHYQIFSSILAADVVKNADIRVIQRRDGASFAIEALFRFRILRKMVRQDLDGNGAIEARIQRAVHLTHSACAERSLYFVWTEFRARGKGHLR